MQRNENKPTFRLFDIKTINGKSYKAGPPDTPILFPKADLALVRAITHSDAKQHGLIYLYQLEQLQKKEWSDWGTQLKTLFFFNEGATYYRNIEHNKSHFERLLAHIENILMKATEKKLTQMDFDSILAIANQAFSGLAMINAYGGATIGNISSYHFMLRSWTRTLFPLRIGAYQEEHDAYAILQLQLEKLHVFKDNILMMAEKPTELAPKS